MATFYSNNFEATQTRPTTYVAKSAAARVAGLMWPIRWSIVLPVGATAGDIVKIATIFANVPTATPQIAGVRFGKVTLKSSGNVGGSITANFGTIAAPTAFGSALTTLQSATILTVADTTLDAAGPILLNTDIQLVLAAGPSTTQQTISGEVWLHDTAP